MYICNMRQTYFLANVPDIELAVDGFIGTADLVVEIDNQEGTTNSVTEVYEFIDGKTTVSGLRDMLSAYFEYDTPQDDWLNGGVFASPKKSVLVDLKAYNNAQLLCTKELEVAFSNVIMPKDDYMQSSVFLTRYNNVMVPLDGISVLNYIYNDAIDSMRAKVTFCKNGENHTIEESMILTAEKGAMVHYVFTWPAISDMLRRQEPACDISDIKYAEISLLGENGKLDSVCFIPKQKTQKFMRSFAFIGAMGELEIMNFLACVAREGEKEDEYVQADDKFFKVTSNLNIIYKAYTGSLSNAERDLVYDLVTSKWVWLVDEGHLVPITILDCELEETEPHVEPTALAFKFRISDNYMQRVFRRKGGES